MAMNQLERIALGLRGYLILFLPVLLLAACSSQQAMTPGQVAELHSGKLIVNIPHNAFRVQSQAPLAEVFVEAMVAAAIAGPVAGGAVAAGNQTTYPSSSKSPVLKPYNQEISKFPLSQDFHVLGSEVVKAVPWIGHTSGLEITHQTDGIGAGRMRLIVQSDNVNAIAFAQPVITFTRDMSALVMRTSISVYIKGERGPVFFDGGAVTASTSLEKSGETLTPDQMDDVDEGRGFINKVRAFRAKLWFANQSERFNIALAEDLRVTKQRLTTFLKGRPHS